MKKGAKISISKKWADTHPFFFFWECPLKKKALFIAPTISPFSTLFFFEKKNPYFFPMDAFFCSFFGLKGDFLGIFVTPIRRPFFFLARPFFSLKKNRRFFDCPFAPPPIIFLAPSSYIAYSPKAKWNFLFSVLGFKNVTIICSYKQL